MVQVNIIEYSQFRVVSESKKCIEIHYHTCIDKV